MAHLVGYAMMAQGSNSLGGHLVKAQCDICGRKFGSLEEAKKCESKHVNQMISNIHKDLFGGSR